MSKAPKKPDDEQTAKRTAVTPVQWDAREIGGLAGIFVLLALVLWDGATPHTVDYKTFYILSAIIAPLLGMDKMLERRGKKVTDLVVTTAEVLSSSGGKSEQNQQASDPETTATSELPEPRSEDMDSSMTTKERIEHERMRELDELERRQK